MNETILAGLLAFAVEYSGLSAKNEQPSIEFKSATAICRKHLGKEFNCARIISSGNHPVALYDWDTNEIWLAHGLNMNDVIDRSYLVHEYVHFLQDMNGEFNHECPSSHEREAYFIQGMYIRSQGVRIPRGIFNVLKEVTRSCSIEW
jgi:hypothetical protein